MALSAGSVEIRLFAELARLQSDMKKANKVVEDAMGGIQKSVKATSQVFNQLVGAFGTVQIIKLADDYKRFDAQLKLSTKSLNEYGQAYANVIRIGRTAQSDISSIGVLYARLNNNMRDLNVTQRQVSDVTETVSLALRVNNATVQETNSVMLQLSQSFGSGKINGQEFLAVAEGAPLLLRQLAKSLGVPFGALKDLSAQSKLTRDVMLKAWTDPAYLEALRQQVKEVGTITSAMTVFMNNLKQYIGESDKATNTSTILANSIKLIADNINFLVAGALAVGVVKLLKWTQGIYASAVATREATAAKVIAAKVELSLAQAAYASGVAVSKKTKAMHDNALATTIATSNTARLIAAQNSLTVATNTLTIAKKGLNTVLSVFGGWIGIVVTGVIVFWEQIVKLKDKIMGLTPELKALNDELERRNRLEKLKIDPDSASSAEQEQLVRNVKLYNEINAQIVRQKSLIESRKGFDLNVSKEEAELVKLNEALDAQSKLMGTNIAQANNLTPAISAVSDEYEKLSEKLKTAKDLSDEYARNVGLINAELNAGRINQDVASAKLEILAEQYKKATGALKEEKKSLKESNDAIREAIELANGLASARNAVVVSSLDINDALRKEIELANEQLITLRFGEEAYKNMERAKLADAIVTNEQIIATAKLNGASKDVIKYAEAYNDTLRERLKLFDELKKAQSKVESDKNIKDAKEAHNKANREMEEERVKEHEEANRRIEEANDKLYGNLARSLTDSVVRGFEEGLSFIDNFKRAIKTAFKSFFVNIAVNYVQGTMQAVLGGVSAALLSGNANAATGATGGGDLLSVGKTVFDGLTQGFGSLNNSLYEGIAGFGTTLRDLGFDQFGTLIENNSTMLGNLSPYLQAGISLLKGDVKGAIFQGVGAAIGSYFGPIGGMVGSFLGGAIGGLFGCKDIPMTGDRVKSKYEDGKITSSTSTFGKSSLGGKDALTQANEYFLNIYGSLITQFDENAKFAIDTIYRSRTNTQGFLRFSLNGESLNGQAGAQKGISFKKFIEKFTGAGLASIIRQSTDIPKAFRDMFKDLKKPEVVQTLINDIVRLNAKGEQLNTSLGITSEQVALLATETGIVGENFSKLVDVMLGTSQEALTVGQALLAIKAGIAGTLGIDMPTSLQAYDEAIRAINTSTAEGRQEFLKYLETRSAFQQYQTAIAGLQSGVRGALFGVVSDAEKQAMMNEDLAKLFSDLNRDVPASMKELIALGKAIDYTTEEGLNLASVFPALVEAFRITQEGVESLMSSLLDANRFRTQTDFIMASAFARNGIPLSALPTENMPSYAVGTSYVPNDGVAMLHQGEAVLTKAENSELRVNTSQMVQLLNRLVSEVNDLKYDTKRGADGAERSARELEDITSGDIVINTQVV
jgi:tape measure domain-containing protein